MINPEQAAYNRVYRFIHESESHFDFKSANAIIDTFAKMFPQFHGMYLNLVDAFNDRKNEIFPQITENRKIA